MGEREVNIELVEKSLLGSMFQENYLITDSNIDTDAFTKQFHKNIFSGMRELVSQSKAVDYITLLSTRVAAELGGANYVADLRNFANVAKFDDYRTILLNDWKERRKKNILVQAQSEDWSIFEIQKALDKIELDENAEDTSIEQDLIAMAERPYKQQTDTRGIMSGLLDLDKMLNGFHPAELTILAARPSMGKTDTMNHLALRAGWDGHLPIIFSIEMPKNTLVDRLIATTGNYNRLKMRDPYQYFSEEQKATWMQTMANLDQANVHIDERSGLKTAQIKAKARQIIKANPGKKPIILIDYLQIIRPDKPQANRAEQIGQISWDLKQIAKELNCPVICLSQLNRKVEEREDKRPIMSDLRDSGNIEQDADVIAFLYRDDYYNAESEDKNTLEINIAKQRNGPTGGVKVAYIKDTGRLLSINWGGIQNAKNSKRTNA